VFEDELERIWYGSWVYVGHESEVPQPGDYVRKQVGLQPVILTRDGGGDLHVMLNRCPHVGNLVCHENAGHARALRCPYHGWTFGLDGTCLSVPFSKAYGPDFDKAARPLAAPPRVDSYRGFVFASMNPDVPELGDHLGHAACSIDQLCDLSPDGEIELSAGWIRHLTRANWKMAFEGGVDGYHPTFVHRSLVNVIGAPSNFEAQDNSHTGIVVRDLGNGHSDLDLRPQYRQSDEEFQWMVGGSRAKLSRYVAALEQRYGPSRTHELLVDGPPHAMIFPNVFIGELFLMVIEPLGPTRHVQLETPVFWKGAPDLNARNLRQTNASLGPAGLVLADDVAMFERTQRGLEARQPEWLSRERGAHRTQVDENGIRIGCMSDDTAILGFWERYRELMAS
jgi:phenylpropionate dioxygenase-like ring-hydroxylating dioxygenase large terminal subunit